MLLIRIPSAEGFWRDNEQEMKTVIAPDVENIQEDVDIENLTDFRFRKRTISTEDKSKIIGHKANNKLRETNSTASAEFDSTAKRVQTSKCRRMFICSAGQVSSQTKHAVGLLCSTYLTLRISFTKLSLFFLKGRIPGTGWF